jgi:hypothetical protein
VFAVASTGVATFIAGVAGLAQSNLYVAVPTLAAAALLGSWTVYYQLKIPAATLVDVGVRHASGAADIVTGRELVGADARVVPRQLPAAVSHFAGRAGELAALSGLLRGRAEAGGTVMISAIGGTAGVGKTTPRKKCSADMGWFGDLG